MQLLLSLSSYSSVQCVKSIAGIQCSAANHCVFIDIEVAAVYVVQSRRKLRVPGAEIGVASFQSRRCHELSIIISVEG